MFQLRFKGICLRCVLNMFLSLFAMNPRYGCLLCMKTLATIRIKMIVPVVQSIGIFFSLRQVKKLVVSVVFAPSHDFLVLKYVLKAAILNGLNMCDRKIEEFLYYMRLFLF